MTTPVSSYAVDLLYEELPLFARDEVLAKLRDRCGAASAMDPSAGGGLNFFFPDLRVPFKEGTAPVQIAMTVTSGPLPAGESQSSLKQTWDWAEAKDALARHQAHVVVSDLLGHGLPYKSRLGFFQNVLGGILELLQPVAIRWRPSQKIVSPAALLKALDPGETRDPIKGAVNVRRTLVKSAGGVVMDTLGLGALGLPDFEVSLGERMPPLFDAMLRSLARYEYDLGDVIAEGRTVKGGGESFRCERGSSSVEPGRDVFVLKPFKASGNTTVR
jgi:Domain of unknown function (DUF4261)